MVLFGLADAAQAQDSARLNGASARLNGASARLNGASARLNGASARLNGASARLNGASARLNGASARLNGASARLNGASARLNGASARPNGASATNIVTDRLEGKDLRRWDAIKTVVFAEDIEGQPSHPTLRRLWDQLERSGHTIYIEMRGAGRAISNTAGEFHIERFDPEG